MRIYCFDIITGRIVIIHFKDWYNYAKLFVVLRNGLSVVPVKIISTGLLGAGDHEIIDTNMSR